MASNPFPSQATATGESAGKKSKLTAASSLRKALRLPSRRSSGSVPNDSIDSQFLHANGHVADPSISPKASADAALADAITSQMLPPSEPQPTTEARGEVHSESISFQTDQQVKPSEGLASPDQQKPPNRPTLSRDVSTAYDSESPERGRLRIRRAGSLGNRFYGSSTDYTSQHSSRDTTRPTTVDRAESSSSIKDKGKAVARYDDPLEQLAQLRKAVEEKDIEIQDLREQLVQLRNFVETNNSEIRDQTAIMDQQIEEIKEQDERTASEERSLAPLEQEVAELRQTVVSLKRQIRKQESLPDEVSRAAIEDTAHSQDEYKALEEFNPNEAIENLLKLEVGLQLYFGAQEQNRDALAKFAGGHARIVPLDDQTRSSTPRMDQSLVMTNGDQAVSHLSQYTLDGSQNKMHQYPQSTPQVDNPTAKKTHPQDDKTS